MCKYAVIDLEMCKVPKGPARRAFGGSCEIIEIGAVLLSDDLKVTGRFKSYVRPEYGRIDGYIENLTGISSEDTDSAPVIKDVLCAFLSWLPEDAVIVSWSDSDKKQLQKELKLKEISLPALEGYFESWEDCQRSFGEKMRTPKVYRLSEALIISDIDFDENLHDGLVDAENTAMLFVKLKTEPTLKLISYYMTEEDEKTMYTPLAEFMDDFFAAI